MFRKIMIALVAALTMTASVAPQADAFSLSSRTRHYGQTSYPANAPLAYKIFCMNNKAECRPSRRKMVTYTPKIRALLVSVNAQVNRQIRPRSESVDVWTVNASAGDCDDYVMTKRHRLIRAGIPASALKVGVVRTRRGVAHAILVVKTSAGEYVLDNLRHSIVRRSQTGYRFLKVV